MPLAPYLPHSCPQPHGSNNNLQPVVQDTWKMSNNSTQFCTRMLFTSLSLTLLLYLHQRQHSLQLIYVLKVWYAKCARVSWQFPWDSSANSAFSISLKEIQNHNANNHCREVLSLCAYACVLTLLRINPLMQDDSEEPYTCNLGFHEGRRVLCGKF